MTANAEREEIIIARFLSGYEHGAWKNRSDRRPDSIERTKKAVDWFAIRESDQKTIAIEHTIVEPFSGDKRDFAFFTIFLEIENDASLAVPGRWYEVFVPVGTLENQRSKAEQEALVNAVHNWIRSNRLTIKDGQSTNPCTVPTVCGDSFEIELTVKSVALRGDKGQINVRRQQTVDDLGEVIERSLKRKLPKLVSTTADVKILLLERQHMNFDPGRIVAEVESRRSKFSELSAVNEIWIVDASVYQTTFGTDFLAFLRYDGGEVVSDFHFYKDVLTWNVG